MPPPPRVIVINKDGGSGWDTYWGNLFSRTTKETSLETSGISSTYRDRKNNVEAVFLEAIGIEADLEVKVNPVSLSGDATGFWPQSQDYGLVIYNIENVSVTHVNMNPFI